MGGGGEGGKMIITPRGGGGERERGGGGGGRVGGVQMIILSMGRVWIFSGVTGENLLFTHIINTSV